MFQDLLFNPSYPSDSNLNIPKWHEEILSSISFLNYTTQEVRRQDEVNLGMNFIYYDGYLDYDYIYNLIATSPLLGVTRN